MLVLTPDSGTGAVLPGEGETPRIERRPEQLDRARPNAVQLQDLLLTQPRHMFKRRATGGDERPARRIRQTGRKITFRSVRWCRSQTGWSFPYHRHRIACSPPSARRPSSGGIVACVAVASDVAVRWRPGVGAGLSPLTLNRRTGVRLFDRIRREFLHLRGRCRNADPSSRRGTRKRRRFRGLRSGLEPRDRTGCRLRGTPSRTRLPLPASPPG